MSEARLQVLDPGSGRLLRDESIRVNGRKPTFLIKSELIEARALKHLDGRVHDLIEIAACAFAADTGISRGGPARADFGRQWRRHFRLDVPVNDPEFWSRPEIKQAVCDALSFLSDDRFELSFPLRVDSDPQNGFLEFNPLEDQAQTVDEVILFSGGIDSLTGTIETLETTNNRVALVTRRSANKLVPGQEELVAKLKARFPKRVIYIPVSAHRTGSESADRTQRTRSFLFSAIAYAVAQAFEAKTIRFFENGIVGHQLPISGQVIGTMATRTTHPLSLHLLQELLQNLDSATSLSNPYEWLTKTQVLERLKSHGGSNLLKTTVSCSSVYPATALHTHCGRCSQCLDRRFAVAASGLEAFDPEEMYDTDVLVGARNEERSQVMALDWTAHGCRLQEIAPEEFVDRFGGELARICEGYPELARSQIIKKCLDLQRRHGKSVNAVLQNAIAAYSREISQGTLPETSLLRGFILQTLGDSERKNSLISPRSSWPTPGLVPPDDPAADGSEDAYGILPLKVRFSREGQLLWIEVINLGNVRGAPARVPHALRAFLEQAIADGLSAEYHGYVHAGKLAAELQCTKSTISQNVKRCRAELSEFHEVITGKKPASPLLIQNRKQHGYRLDPTCRIIG